MRVIILCFYCAAFCYGQNVPTKSRATTAVVPKLHNGISEIIGNFSLELLYFTSKSQGPSENLIMSPITAWTVMAVIDEGAEGNTLSQLNRALRLNNNRTKTRTEFLNVARWLQDNTTTIELANYNAIFVDQGKLIERDFVEIARNYYNTFMVPLNFSDGERTAALINQRISQLTHGKIPKLVEASYFGETQMILTSALYFKGQWTAPFNVSSTSKMPFYDSNGQKIGDVNMMYNRYTYPFANIREIQARVIELPYGTQNRLSMLIMLPNPGVSLEDMFSNFLKVPLDTVFKELKISSEEYGDDEVDCLIPRFKINSDLILTDILKNFGIYDLFNPNQAWLPYMARMPMYVTRVVHKAEIEVTEEGTTASGVTAAEFANRISAIRFEANRPFSYLIVEKVTNSIVFGGVYRNPSLY